MKKISIITVNYNNAEGIRETIDSVVKQTSKEVEYIIIDGGSTDGSVEVIKEYSDKIYFWVSEKDNGIYNAMNKGISHANGEYLLFLNSGDCLHSTTTIDDFLALNPKDDILTGKEMAKDNKLIIPNESDRPLTFSFLFRRALRHQSTFIRRSLFDEHLYDEHYRIASDHKFFLQTLIIDNHSFSYIPMVVSEFDTTGISNKNEELSKIERNDIFASLFPPRVIADYERLMPLENSPFIPLISYINKKSTRFQSYLYKLNYFIYKIYRLLSKN